MAWERWFQADIQHHITASLVMAIETAAAHGMANIEYLGGVLAMGKGMALSFGVSWPSVIVDCRGALGDDLAGLLDQARLIDG